VEHVERTGDPSEQLAVLAAGHEAAVIVIGSHRTGWRSMLSRSVATRLQNHVRHPLVVVPRRAALPVTAYATGHHDERNETDQT
jgi:nucleotide-binding universal stress UspA family protein